MEHPCPHCGQPLPPAMAAEAEQRRLATEDYLAQERARDEARRRWLVYRTSGDDDSYWSHEVGVFTSEAEALAAAERAAREEAAESESLARPSRPGDERHSRGGWVVVDGDRPAGIYDEAVEVYTGQIDRHTGQVIMSLHPLPP